MTLVQAGEVARPGQDFFDRALCSPVLTAHPTEIRRKSSIDREMEIARLLDERDRVEFTPEELAANRRALRRNVLTLWQTSLVRGSQCGSDLGGDFQSRHHFDGPLGSDDFFERPSCHQLHRIKIAPTGFAQVKH